MASELPIEEILLFWVVRLETNVVLQIFGCLIKTSAPLELILAIPMLTVQTLLLATIALVTQAIQAMVFRVRILTNVLLEVTTVDQANNAFTQTVLSRIRIALQQQRPIQFPPQHLLYN